uniref:Uncharacterized protein n=1 Tax=Psilocybe cubensis TaxID=181762 RepID=A0A8H7XP71_PSICU
MSSQDSDKGVPCIECQCKDCQCHCHCSGATGDELPPPDERWYSVVVGRSPGVVQGQDHAERNWRGVSGGAAFYCPDRPSAEQHFVSALHRGEAVHVIPEVRIRLGSQDRATLPGFRVHDPYSPENATWVVVSVGREPGIYLIDSSYSGYGLTLTSNVNGVSGGHVIKFKSRSAAVEEFERMLSVSLIVRVVTEVRAVLMSDGVE